MDLLVTISTGGKCEVSVTDVTGVSSTGYLPEDSTATVKGRFKYSDTVSIDLLQHNKSTGTNLQNPIYHVRTTDNEIVTLSVEFDGWFTVMHIVLPSKDWFDTEFAKEEGSAIGLYNTVYYTDGEYIYKYFDGQTTVVMVDEIVERNTDDTTISRVCENYVSICFLRQCYISLSQQILNTRGFSACASKNTVDKDLTNRKDYVWMALNVIEYLVGFDQLAEAERLIEQIGGCNGLCKTEFKRMPTSRCGCGK